MKGLRLAVFVLCAAVFLGAAYIPNVVLKATVDTTLGVFLLLVAVLACLSLDSVLAIAVFLAGGALFFENRKRMVARLREPKMKSAPMSVEFKEPASVASLSVAAPDLVDGEVHPEHEEPTVDDYKFQPKSDSSDEFEAVGESINEKVPLDAAPSNSSQAAAAQLTRAGVV
jgi:hypothetical protein